ncbi:MAG: hypothetical protein H6736_04135 [Alphaproteobacteria bacterium]|nr:hypothetical protein [Alphaproteobacteria bacterium]
MALPALRALALRGPLVVHAPTGLHPLYDGFDVRPVGRIRADVAVLFAPSLRAALEARGVRSVVGTPTDHRGFLLTKRVPEQPSRPTTYALLASAVGAVVEGEPTFAPRGRAWDVPAGHLAVLPMAGSANRRWAGFTQLADRWPGPVVFYGGPGEERPVAAVAGRHRTCVGPGLADLAATLQRAAVVVANDNGLAHFARAVGRPVVVVHTSTTAARTGPAGAVAVEGPPLICRPCYRNTCSEALGCMDVPLDAVLSALEQVC